MKIEFFKKFYNKIPKLPLSALIFYLFVLILWNFNLIPSPIEIINFLENLYESYGLMALFIASLLEGLVYIGLYFAGSSMIAIIVIASDGTLITLLSISLIVALSLTITSVINYVLGRHIISRPLRETKEIKKKRKMSKGLILSCLHPNALAFYFFNLGIKKESPYKVIFVPLIMIPYGFLIAYLLYQLKPFIEKSVENPYILIIIIMIWMIIAFMWERVKRK